MIGLVEQLLTGKHAMPSQPAGTEERQSPKETVEKGTSFLALLAQLFGGLVHHTVQKPELPVESADPIVPARQPVSSGRPFSEQGSVEAVATDVTHLIPSATRSLQVASTAHSAEKAEQFTHLLSLPSAERRSGEGLSAASVGTEQPPIRTEGPTIAERSVEAMGKGKSSAPDPEFVPSDLVNVREPMRVLNRQESVSANSTSVAAAPSEQIRRDNQDFMASPVPGESEMEASPPAAQTERRQAREILPDGLVRIRGDEQSGPAPHSSHVREGAADGRSQQTRATAQWRNPINPWDANAEDLTLEANVPVRGGRREDEPATASTFSVDWGKMKLSVRNIPSVHQLTPAETTVALKAVADSFSLGRALSSQNDSHMRTMRKAEQSLDSEVNRTDVQSTAHAPQDFGGEMKRKLDLVQENAPPAAADNTTEEGVPDWSTIRVMRKEQAEQSLQATNVTRPIEGTEKSIAMQVTTPMLSAKAEGIHGEKTSTKTPGRIIELPEDFARDFVVRIADELRLHVAGKTSEVRVRLKPEHLGELSLKVTLQEGELAARLDVSMPAVKAALDAQLPQLREALASQGIEIRRFDVVADGQGNAQHEHQRSQHQPQAGRQKDVELMETYAAMRDLGYNTVEYII